MANSRPFVRRYLLPIASSVPDTKKNGPDFTKPTCLCRRDVALIRLIRSHVIRSDQTHNPRYNTF
ncbi:predicted protein [Arabidopsis lyrata subsp. lyrata]|uniref:Predicted protein n=1 Tax=Arabidopsis lyrata subsp. lyrata TaxID=81972 RepID=D7KFT4_ARALL|nr:predicted protein [Arabidopsis lyrata subsp. lyrata]